MITNPESVNCIAMPCTYKGECRDRSGTCGDTAVHCNTESQWVPACGGGAGLDRPNTEQQQTGAQQTAPPTNRPTNMRPKPTMAPQATVSSIITNEPTTKWHAWINANNKPENGDGGDSNNGSEDDPTTGNEDDPTNGNNPNNKPEKEQDLSEQEWFNETTWDGRYQDKPREDEDEGGVLDKINFWDKNSAMESSQSQVVFLVGVIVAWAILL